MTIKNHSIEIKRTIFLKKKQIKCPEQDIPTKPSLKYKNLVVNGAKLNKFPEHYVRMVEAIEDNGETDCGPKEC